MNRAVSKAEFNTQMTPFEDVKVLVVDRFRPLPSESVPVADSLGMTLAADIVSSIDIPPLPSSTMDGYAFAHADLDNGTTRRFEKVMTGKTIASFADTVVQWENASVAGDVLTLTADVPKAMSVRQMGESVSKGSVVVAAGTAMTPLAVGAAASVGTEFVEVVRKVRVAILSSGDELRSIGNDLVPGDVFDSNSLMLAALVQKCGGEVLDQACLPDDREQIVEYLRDASSKADLIITSGGASVGEHDWVRDAIEELGSVNLWRISLKPGKPFALGTIGSASVFVLPGNPASVLACFHAFVAPAMRKLHGQPAIARELAALSADVSAPPDRTFMYPVYVREGVATPAQLGTSSKIVNHFAANAYAYIPAGGAAEGNRVEVERFLF